MHYLILPFHISFLFFFSDQNTSSFFRVYMYIYILLLSTIYSVVFRDIVCERKKTKLILFVRPHFFFIYIFFSTNNSTLFLDYSHCCYHCYQELLFLIIITIIIVINNIIYIYRDRFDG